MSAGPIRLDVVREGRLQRRPFAWGRLDGVLEPHAALALREEFPTEGFTRSVRRSGEKSYVLWARPLWSEGGQAAAETLAPVWRRFAAALHRPDYRDALTGLTGVDVRACPLEVTAWRYEPGCWLSPHLDKPEKRVTQLFYFNDEWDPAWGGCLQILRSPDGADVAEEIPPHLNTSVVLVRSTASWHAVAPVAATAEVPARLTVTAIFYADEAPSS